MACTQNWWFVTQYVVQQQDDSYESSLGSPKSLAGKFGSSLPRYFVALEARYPMGCSTAR